MMGPQHARMRPATTFVHFVCTIKTLQQFGQLGTLFIVIFSPAVREPAHSTWCVPLP